MDKKPAKIIKRKKRQIPDDVVRYVNHSMTTAKQINDYLRELGWTQKYFAEQLGKKESEISKWLTGTHNFTTKTLSKIESVLNRDLILYPRNLTDKTYQILVMGNSAIKVSTKAESKNIESTKIITNGGIGPIPKECFVNMS